MSDRFPKNMTPDFGSYSLEDVLAEYRKSAYRNPAYEARRVAMASVPEPPEAGTFSAPEPETDEPAAVAVRGLLMPESPAETDETAPAPAAADEMTAEQAEHARAAAATSFRETLLKLRAESVKSTEAPRPDADESPASDGASEASVDFRPDAESGNNGGDGFAPAKPGADGHPPDEDTASDAGHSPGSARRRAKAPARVRSLADRVIAPIVRFAATRAALRQQQSAEAANWPDPVDVRETPELHPARAAKFYASLARPLLFRCAVASALCLFLMWICFRLPMTGMLGASLPLQAGVSLALLLACMVAALDVIAVGVRQIIELTPGAESLAAASALLACVDAILVLFGVGDALPFCAISAVTLTCALWSERLTCVALRRTFTTALSSKTPAALTSAAFGDNADRSLIRVDGASLTGIVRRSETQNICQTAYATAAPIFLACALLLAVAASVTRGLYFMHTFSGLVAVSASFASFLSFPLPFAITTRRLRSSGTALAGFAGCADIGRTPRVVITDEDLFPPGNMRFTEINILDVASVEQVCASTSCLLSAYGSGVSVLFDELMSRRGYRVLTVDEFTCHEGGGLSGLVDGARVLTGSLGFMNLMGIRLPRNLQTKNTICTAIEGELVGVFAIEYIPVSSVQEALVTLLRSRTETIFAIRDFNITPYMIRQLFRVPTDSFTFPSFRDRFGITADGADGDRPIDAVFNRSGMLPMIEATEAGRRLFAASRTGTILSLVSAAVGMIIMFLLCSAGAYGTASTGNVLSFMVLWTLPVLILGWGQSRG